MKNLNKEDPLEIKLGDDEQEATVEMNEDGGDSVVKKEDAPTVELEDPKQVAKKQSEDLDVYSAGVQKRIDKLTARLRETERRENAAIEFAKSVQSKQEELERRFQKTDADRLVEASSRVDTQISALKQVIKAARAEYDIDTETEAQQRLTDILMEKRRISEAATYRQQSMNAPRPAAQAQLAPQAQRTQQQPSDPQAESWAEENPWFGTDRVMTGAVRGIHLDLVQKEGFDPQSREYYDEINRRIRDIFPNKFQNESSQQNNRSGRPVQTIAPAARSSGVNSSARRTIRLSPSQVAIAKKLGVPLEEYAKYVKE
tara:strand:+ start:4437 stop:5381 length:945 start_codon:yes stop_codon:yes gene_type:complete